MGYEGKKNKYWKHKLASCESMVVKLCVSRQREKKEKEIVKPNLLILENQTETIQYAWYLKNKRMKFNIASTRSSSDTVYNQACPSFWSGVCLKSCKRFLACLLSS